MAKKFIVALLLAAVLGTGAFAQLIVGASGALHMDTQLSSDEIAEKFQKGEDIYYGPFAEIVFDKLGIGASFNFSIYTWETYAPSDIMATEPQEVDFISYDATIYLSYHLFGGKAFLDPFGEFGFGLTAFDYADEAEQEAYDTAMGYDFDEHVPMAANAYYYGALGVGVNLGTIGVFGKLSYNASLPDFHLTGTNLDGSEFDVENQLDENGDPYVPPLRFTLGVKLLL